MHDKRQIRPGISWQLMPMTRQGGSLLALVAPARTGSTATGTCNAAQRARRASLTATRTYYRPPKRSMNNVRNTFNARVLLSAAPSPGKPSRPVSYPLSMSVNF